MISRITILSRVCLLVGLQAGFGVGLRWLTLPAIKQSWDAFVGGPTPAGGWTLERVVIDSAACLAWVAFTVVVTATVVTVALGSCQPSAGTATEVERPGCLAWWRRAVLCACGIGLVAPVAASPSLARDHRPHPTCATACFDGSSGSSGLSGLRLPDLPDSSLPRRTTDGSVRVRPGDSLWR
ncbi:MAG: hypothetical protein H0V07_11165, partial [Propionibacteriales bacterium]|nr:hypothetical protein [Propionibacteriales bacterium]